MKLNNIQKQLGKIAEVIWLDASFRSSQNNEDLKDIDPEDLLVRSVTIGRILMVNNKAIVLEHISNDITKDVSTIPFGMIKEIKITKCM